MTVEKVHARAVELARALDVLDDLGDEAEQRQTSGALMNAIDEEPRPRAIGCGNEIRVP
jgi:hypothetical protein